MTEQTNSGAERERDNESRYVAFIQAGRTVECGHCHPEKYTPTNAVCCVCHDKPAPEPDKPVTTTRYYCRRCKLYIPASQAEVSPSNCSTGLSHNGPMVSDDPRDAEATCWGVVELQTEATTERCTEPCSGTLRRIVGGFRCTNCGEQIPINEDRHPHIPAEQTATDKGADRFGQIVTDHFAIVEAREFKERLQDASHGELGATEKDGETFAEAPNRQPFYGALKALCAKYEIGNSDQTLMRLRVHAMLWAGEEYRAGQDSRGPQIKRMRDRIAATEQYAKRIGALEALIDEAMNDPHSSLTLGLLERMREVRRG